MKSVMRCGGLSTKIWTTVVTLMSHGGLAWKTGMKTALFRFNQKYTVDANGCWIWTAAKHRDGYGQFKYDGNMKLAHRVSYALFIGEPGDMCVLHRCDTPACVNPEHLFLGTQTDNMQDMATKGRACGQANTHCKYGHEWSEDNTAIDWRGHRRCRACVSVWNKNYHAKKKG